MSKRKPTFITDYEKKLKRQCNKITNRIKVFNSIYQYSGRKIKEVVYIPPSVTTFGMAEATIITEDNRHWNAGSQIFDLKEVK
jgi:hypothetical protein